MTLAKVLAAAAIAASFGSGPSYAQSSGMGQIPAEFPPETYKGRQYVDSDGCVFIRAGVDGNVTWVPRVSRDRKVICGFQPTFAVRPSPETPATETADAAPAKPAAAQAAAGTAAAAPAPRAAPAAPEPAPRATATVAAAKPEAAKPEPEPAEPVKVVTKQKPAHQAAARTACPQASAVAQRYLKAVQGVAVRCGPQEAPHVSAARVAPSHPTAGSTLQQLIAAEAGQAAPTVKVVRVAPAAATTTATVAAPQTSPGTRIVIRPADGAGPAGLDGIRVPDGYKRVWDDDRLNPDRGVRTSQGDAATDRIWSRTVPRRLIDDNSHRDARQAVSAPATTTTTKKQATVSTRSVARANPAAPAAAPSHRYVQAGFFGVPANAQRAAQRIAGAGLPARMARMQRGGKNYTLVLAGPFKTQAQLQAALGQVRRAGFGDAFLRR